QFDVAFDPGALYVAYQCLVVSHDGARTWKSFSPDLTTAKGVAQIPCGTPLPPPPPAQPNQPRPQPAPENTINDFSISKVKPGVVWTVSSNGQIYNTMDHGKVWNNVSNITGAPPHTSFGTITAGDDVN